MIDITNYESYLYLYQEDELAPQDRKEVEQFLTAHPDIKAEMERYYDPTFVIPTENATKEHHLHPVWKWAAAACLALTVGSTLFYFNTQPTLPTDTMPTTEMESLLPPLHSEWSSPIFSPSMAAPTHHKLIASAKPIEVLVEKDTEIRVVSATPTPTETATIIPNPVNATPQPAYIETTKLAEVSQEVNFLAEEINNYDFHIPSAYDIINIAQAFGKQQIQNIFPNLN